MKINELMKLVGDHYDDRGTDAFWDYKNERIDCDGTGDTLAEFIVREIYETFEPANSTDDQLEEAIRVMQCARNQLNDVVSGLVGGATKLLERE